VSNALLEKWHQVGDMLKDALEHHTEQLGDRKQADFDHNTQLGHLTSAVHSYRRELHEYIDKAELRWAALFDHLELKDPTRG
jgi:hypothetical protein